MNDFQAFLRERTLRNLQRRYCHGGPHSIRFDFAMWTWSFKWYGPKGGERRDVFGKRNWMPHEQPKVCSKCGFVFSFLGCDRLHLGECNGRRFIDIKDGIAFEVIDCEVKVLDSESKLSRRNLLKPDDKRSANSVNLEREV